MLEPMFFAKLVKLLREAHLLSAKQVQIRLSDHIKDIVDAEAVAQEDVEG